MRTSPPPLAGLRRLATVCTLVFLAGPLEAAGPSAQPPGAPPPAARVDFNVAAGEASVTLKQFSGQSGQTVVYLVDVVRGQPTAAVKGRYTPREALDLMLAGSGLVVSQDAKTGALAVRKGAADPNGGRATPAVTSVRPDANPKPELDGVVTLSPFEVSTTADVGYLARSTLGGTRLNTALRDVASQVAVMTPSSWRTSRPRPWKTPTATPSMSRTSRNGSRPPPTTAISIRARSIMPLRAPGA